MNDFNKEEIKEILWAVDYVRDRTTNRSDAMRRLQGKILSMIDNYPKCEHQSQTPSLKSYVHICIKCFEEYCI
jgi:hypothetical protein